MMATKVDSSSPAEPRRGQSNVSSAVSASSPKVSMFGAKSGFVIPKNKLSGSLVPIFRGGSKVDAGNNVKEESTKQVRRKTKWGVDLTQDASVRKGRALAYQARLEQITQQLNSGVLETGEDEYSQSEKQDSSQQSTIDHDVQKAKKFELLELEKREIIGEILRLNPSYKAPHDYKPLLKEGQVPIPDENFRHNTDGVSGNARMRVFNLGVREELQSEIVRMLYKGIAILVCKVKAYPGYNFIGLLLGSESNAQKRLEEETGAKIRIYGTKVNTKEKQEITQSDVTEAQGAYEELFVNVSADTYEKVDAAVSLIELLLTPVSGTAVNASKKSSSVAGDNTNISQPNQDTSSHGMTMVTDVNQVVPQPMLLTAQSGQQQFQQQYSAPWFPTDTSNAPPRPAGGIFPLSTPNNRVRFPSHGGPQYLQPTPFGSAPRASSSLTSRPQVPLQAMQQLPPNQVFQYQNQGMPGQQPPPAYPVMSASGGSVPPASFPASRPMLSGPMPPSRPSAPINQQPGYMVRPSVTTTTASPGISSGWFSPSPVVPPQRPNTMQMAPQPFSPHIRLQQISLPPQPNMPHNVIRPPSVNFSPATFPSQPTVPASFTPVRPQIGPVLVPAAIPSSSGVQLQAPVPPVTSVPSSIPSSVPSPLPVGVKPPTPIPQTPVSQPSSSLSASAPIAAQVMGPSESVAPLIARPPGSVPSVAPGLANSQLQTPQLPSAAIGSKSGSIPSLSPVNPPSTSLFSTPPVPASKPLRPSSGDFTFQPLRAQVSESPTAPRPNTLPVAQHISPVPHAAPHAPSFRPASQNLRPTMGMQNVPLLSAVNLQRPTQAPIPPSPTTPTPFPTNPTTFNPPPMFPFPNSNPVPPRSPATQVAPSRPMTPAKQMGPLSFSPALQAPTLASALPARLPNFVQLNQNQLPPANRPGSLIVPNQQHVGSNQLGSVSGYVPSPSGGNQFYDPFSPTSISPAPPQQGGEPLKVRKQETDAEYEDLMASVGVK